MIRKVRKEKGWRLEDLADEQISIATISNIERGFAHVKPEKTHYLIQKLKIDPARLPRLMMKEQQDLKELEFELKSLQLLRDTGDAALALEHLNRLKLEASHPYAAMFHYLKGKCYLSLRKWKEAEKFFHQAIRFSHHHEHAYSKKSNIKAVSFIELGLCAFFQNDLVQAIRYTDRGWDVYEHDGERSYAWWLLHINKAVYYERLGQLAESMQVIQKAWEGVHQTEKKDIVITFYYLRSEILRRSGVYDEAVTFAIKGLELARLNGHTPLLFDLWTVLGSTYMAKEDWFKAERCFNHALRLKDRLFDDPMVECKIITAFARLGKLYTQQKKWEQAGRVIREAIATGEKYEDAPRLTYALQVMGDYYQVQGRMEEGIPYYERALALARKYNYKKRACSTLIRLPDYWRDTNREELLAYLETIS
ncbi:helix-turn-helix domain-containing protein [Paludifilum halophilum]|nr:tetratricopeptide repeat protein [Paludifilum halophilum]